MRATLLSAIVVCVACGPHRAHPRGRTRAATTVAPGTAGPSGATPEAQPLPDPTPLADELSSRESLASCRERVRTGIAPDLAELLGELGYDAAPDDVCLALAAVRSGDPSGCDSLSVSAVRRGCRRRVAIAHGAPAACPDDVVGAGREPVCLAWAAHDPGLCRGASHADEPRCRAVFANDSTGCHDAVDAAECARDVHRFGSLVAGAPRAQSAARDIVPAFTVTLRGHAATTVEADASPTVARGVVLESCGGDAYFTLGPSARDEALPSFVETPTPWLSVVARLGEDGRNEHISLGGPDARASLVVVMPHNVSVTSELGADATVTHEPIRLARGALLSGVIAGTMPGAREALQVSGTFRTFVRDVVERSPPCRR